MRLDEFSVTKDGDSSILRTHVSHLYSKKGKYIVKLKTITTCPQEDSEIQMAYVGSRDLVLIKKIKAPLESIIKKMKYEMHSICINI